MTQKAQVLVLESVPSGLTSLLLADGFSVDQASSWPPQSPAPDLILCSELDAVATICQQIRASHCFVPLLVVLSRDDPAARQNVLRAGADSCLAAPVNPEELLAYVHTLLRRAHLSDWAPWTSFHLGITAVNLVTGVVLRGDEVHKLSPPQLGILCGLVARPNQTVPPEDLARHAGESTASSVAIHIKALRRKLEPIPSQPRYLLPDRGRGFRLVGRPRDAAGRIIRSLTVAVQCRHRTACVSERMDTSDFTRTGH